MKTANMNVLILALLFALCFGWSAHTRNPADQNMTSLVFTALCVAMQISPVRQPPTHTDAPDAGQKESQQ